MPSNTLPPLEDIHTLTYSQAFHRLETILEEMNAHDIELERSLVLFEEADTLITYCQNKLMNAEKRVEMVLKTRNGTPLLNKDGQISTSSLPEHE